MNCSFCRVRRQKSELRYRHAELRATEVKKKLGIFRPAYCSLYLLCSQEREREKLIPPFSFSVQQSCTSSPFSLYSDCPVLPWFRGRGSLDVAPLLPQGLCTCCSLCSICFPSITLTAAHLSELSLPPSMSGFPIFLSVVPCAFLQSI